MNKIQALTKKKNKNKEVTDIIKDTNLPLEYRWDLYIFTVSTKYLINNYRFYLDLRELGLDIEDIGYTKDKRNKRYNVYDILENL